MIQVPMCSCACIDEYKTTEVVARPGERKASYKKEGNKEGSGGPPHQTGKEGATVPTKSN